MKDSIKIRKYTAQDIPAMVAIWNEIVEEGNAFPQEECLTEITGAEFLEARPIAAWPRTRRQGISWDCTFCTPTMWGGAGISATQAMPCRRKAGGGTLGKNWF